MHVGVLTNQVESLQLQQQDKVVAITPSAEEGGEGFHYNLFFQLLIEYCVQGLC